MNLILIPIIFISGWLLGLATFLAGSLWRGGVGTSIQTEISDLLAPGSPAPGSSAPGSVTASGGTASAGQPAT